MAESLGSLDKVDLVVAHHAFLEAHQCSARECWASFLRALQDGRAPAFWPDSTPPVRAAVLASRADRRAMAESAARKRREMG